MAKQPAVVQLYYSGGWHDVPVYTRTPIRITRGTSPEGSDITPATAQLTIDNRTGEWDPSNPFSVLRGKAGRNTPIRFLLDAEVRFSGEVVSWKPRRSTEDVDLAKQRGDAWVAVEAAGILWRLGQGADVLESPVTRALERSSPLAWWPLELDLTPGIAGVLPGQIVSSPVGPAVRQPLQLLTDDVVGTAALVDVSNGTRVDLPVPAHTLVPTTGYQIEFMSRWQPGGFTGGLSVSALRMDFTPVLPGDVERVEVETDTSGEVFTFTTQLSGGFIRDDAVSEGDVYDGAVRHIRVLVYQFSTWVNTEMYIDGSLMTFATLPASTLTNLRSISLNQVGEVGTKIPALGQVVVYPDQTLGPGTAAADGYLSETAADRFQRLCDEEGITCTIIGAAADSAPMGPQPIATLLGQFGDIKRTDDGIVYDTRATLGLTYRTGRSRTNQTSVLDLTFPGHVTPPLDPAIDDLGTRNDVTARSLTGSARAVLESGTMSVLAPPDGVGRTTTSVDVTPESDSSLPDIARWYLARGTIADPRYPRVVVDLVANPALMADVEGVDVGDLLTLAGLPRGTARLHAPGYVEDIGSHTRTVTFVTVPEGPYRIGVWGTDAQGSRWGAADSTLAAAVDDDDTVWLVNPGTDVWATSASHPAAFPFNIDVAELTYSCTAIAPGIADAFGRSVASGWGSADTGQAWSAFGAGGTVALANFNVAAGVGTHAVPVANANRATYLSTLSLTDAEVLVTVTLPVTNITGASVEPANILLRGTSLSSYYVARVEITTAEAVLVKLYNPAGVLLASATVAGLTHTSAQALRVRALLRGDFFAIRVWPAAGTEPDVWHATALDATAPGPGWIGVASGLASGNTNAPLTFSYDDLQVVAPLRFTVTRLPTDKPIDADEQVWVTDTGRYGLG